MDFDFNPKVTGMRGEVARAFAGGGDTQALQIEETDQTAMLRELTRAVCGLLVQPGYWEQVAGPASEERGFTLASAEMEAAGHSVSLGISIMATRIATGLVKAYGAAEVASPILEHVRAGSFIAALSLAGKGENSVAFSKKADGSYIINGTLTSCINGPIADIILVHDTEGGTGDVAIVTPGTDGMEIGPRTRTPGVGGAAISDITFNGVKVDPKHVLASANAGGAVSVAIDLGLATASAGLMSSVFNAIKDLAGSQMVNGKPMMSDQHIRYKIAEILMQVQAAEHLIYRTVWMQGTLNAETTTLVNAAKVFCSENAGSVASAAMLISGSTGFKSGTFFERAYRDAIYLGIAGTNAANARSAIADALLRD